VVVKLLLEPSTRKAKGGTHCHRQGCLGASLGPGDHESGLSLTVGLGTVAGGGARGFGVTEQVIDRTPVLLQESGYILWGFLTSENLSEQIMARPFH